MENGPGGRTCTRTGRGLSSLPLHWATPGIKLAAPDGLAPSTFRFKVGCSRCLSYRAISNVDAHPGLAPGVSVLQADGSTLRHVRDLKPGLTNRTRTGTAAFTGRDANCYNMVNIWEWRSREDLHLEPPPSHGGMQISCTSGA